jgi:hypothetical protein
MWTRFRTQPVRRYRQKWCGPNWHKSCLWQREFQWRIQLSLCCARWCVKFGRRQFALVLLDTERSGGFFSGRTATTCIVRRALQARIPASASAANGIGAAICKDDANLRSSMHFCRRCHAMLCFILWKWIINDEFARVWRRMTGYRMFRFSSIIWRVA